MKYILHAHVWSLLVLFTQVMSCSARLHAGDWPMYRYDASRSNASPHALPRELHLQWSRTLPKPQPAWPATQAKLQFDAVCQPIIVGKLLIVGSTTDDSITAFDTETGTEVWRFYTDGPVRFAPAAHHGNIYAASDDGTPGAQDHGEEGAAPRNQLDIARDFEAAPETTSETVLRDGLSARAA